ncbi:hypothetical protein GYMLUDRAFT_155580 [Collybiopsis luxurians FD-317 M1]|nr:hypothetical protein GYMLUDRAFT_155580 [Collybiopsis luxurians FD-317 M1]
MESSRSSRLAEAIERRIGTQGPQGPSSAEMAAEHAKRQKFRRLIDPGILRPNPEPQASESLKESFIIYKLADNLLREPENPKFQRIKTTNSQVTKYIVNPKGTVEFLREVVQPYYSFNPTRISDLKIGTAMLKETLDLLEEKKARTTTSKQTVAEARAEVVEKVHLQFMEDRRAKMEVDEREKQLRQARAEIAARQEAQQRAEQERASVTDQAPNEINDD